MLPAIGRAYASNNSSYNCNHNNNNIHIFLTVSLALRLVTARLLSLPRRNSRCTYMWVCVCLWLISSFWRSHSVWTAISVSCPAESTVSDLLWIVYDFRSVTTFTQQQRQRPRQFGSRAAAVLPHYNTLHNCAWQACHAVGSSKSASTLNVSMSIRILDVFLLLALLLLIFGLLLLQSLLSQCLLLLLCGAILRKIPIMDKFVLELFSGSVVVVVFLMFSYFCCISCYFCIFCYYCIGCCFCIFCRFCVFVIVVVFFILSHFIRYSCACFSPQRCKWQNNKAHWR